MNKHERMIEMHIKRGVKILNALPDGWHYDKLATTAPVGYIWANNGVSRFDKSYESALIKINK